MHYTPGFPVSRDQRPFTASIPFRTALAMSSATASTAIFLGNSPVYQRLTQIVMKLARPWTHHVGLYWEATTV
jgi:hypothetical protein